MIVLEVFGVLAAMCAALTGAVLAGWHWYDRREALRDARPMYTPAPAAFHAAPIPAAGAGATTPGPVRLPEGNPRLPTAGTVSPQETTGPGNLPPLFGVVVYHPEPPGPVAEHAAAGAAVKALHLDDYLDQLEDETAYSDERPLTDWLRDSVVMPAIKGP